MQLFRIISRFLLAVPLVLTLIIGSSQRASASTSVLIHILAASAAALAEPITW